MACFAVLIMERCDLSIVPKPRRLELWQTVTGISAVLAVFLTIYNCTVRIPLALSPGQLNG